MKKPTYKDPRKFCEIDGWEPKKSATGKIGDHFRYRKVLEDGRLLETRVSHGNDQIADPGLWKRIWSQQLELESPEKFWEALETGKPAKREPVSAPEPTKPSLPGWLVRALSTEVRLADEEILELSEEEARNRLIEFRSEPLLLSPLG